MALRGKKKKKNSIARTKFGTAKKVLKEVRAGLSKGPAEPAKKLMFSTFAQTCTRFCSAAVTPAHHPGEI